ncbi:MAG: selenide, water dikinase SelD [Deltaproteobacteria bacterium]|nr:selenide, water dikinase SelD [Deltaproteobacteria bacterium]
MGPGVLAQVLSQLPLESDPRLLVGRESSDDAGVYQLDDQTALVQTVDFFTPMVNDPYSFGQVAAANALSDVYAMGGQPLTVMNLVCFPAKGVDQEILLAILKGGLDKTRQAGALLVGGHSVDDQEIKYGLSVLGLVHPDKIVTNSKARPGQVLVLTKPLGTGIMATALKGRLLPAGAEEKMIEIMAALNDQSAAAMLAAGVETATDVTGFGLLGHALEMAQASGVELVIEASRTPIIEEVMDLARMGLIPAGSHANQQFCSTALIIEDKVDPYLVNVLSDAQTSGGLLMAVEPDRLEGLLADLKKRGVEAAAAVGRVGPAGPGRIRVTN